MDGEHLNSLYRKEKKDKGDKPYISSEQLFKGVNPQNSAPKKTYRFAGECKTELVNLVNNYNIPFKGDVHLDHVVQALSEQLQSRKGTQEQKDKLLQAELDNTPAGKLSRARDSIIAFVFNLYQDHPGEYHSLRISGFTEILVQVKSGGTCNMELAKKLLACLQ